jgi:hypothetical protein
MIYRQDELRWEVSRAHPTFDAAAVDASATTALYAATAFHVVMALASCALAASVRPRRRSRLILTTTLVSMLVAGVTSWLSSRMFHAAVIGVSIVEFSALALIWCWPSARSYFTALLPGADGIPVDPLFDSSTRRRGNGTPR